MVEFAVHSVLLTEFRKGMKSPVPLDEILPGEHITRTIVKGNRTASGEADAAHRIAVRIN